MLDFQFVNPTKIIFGKNSVDKLGEEVSNYGKRALLVTGQSSVKASGLYDRAVSLMKDKGIEIHDLTNIRANPLLSDCERGVEICKKNNIDVIVAVGGGSVLDTAKAISVGALDDGDLWDFFINKRTVQKALPVISVMTVAATGSEYDGISVVRNERLHKKFGLVDVHIYPKVSLLDPQLTYTVSPRYTAYGALDIISHVLESYIDGQDSPLLQARFVEGLITTVMESVETVLENPEDYEARAYLMWASSLACCDLFAVGTGGGTIAAHMVECEIGALYDTPHGAGLSVILPAVMRYRLEKYLPTTARFAEKIMKVERKWHMSDTDIAIEGIEAFRKWLKKVGNPITLKELGVKKEDLENIAERIASNDYSPDKETALGILNTYYE